MVSSLPTHSSQKNASDLIYPLTISQCLAFHLTILLCMLDSQAYRKMDVTWERISRILELREILLSIQTGFSLVNAALSVLSWRVSQAWNPHQL